MMTICQCGHAIEEHGRDPKHPGSTACTECDCIAFEAADDDEESAISMEGAQQVWDAQVDRHTNADGEVDVDAFNAESRANAKKLGMIP